MNERDEARDRRIANRRRAQTDNAVTAWTVRAIVVVVALGTAYVAARLAGLL